MAEPLSTDHRAQAHALLRLSLGVNFFCHGFFRVLSGTALFADATAQHLAKGPLPHGLVYLLAFSIPWIELLLGIALILGVFTRIALIAGMLFLMLLTVGITSIQDWATAGQQLMYSLVFFVLLFTLQHNRIAVDAVAQRRKPV